MNKERLSQWIGRLELALVVAGGIVVIGLIVEDGPEFWQSLLTWTWPSRAAVGGLLVTLGVLAEVLIAFVIAQIARRIDVFADADTAMALERAAQAELRAAELSKQLEDERTERFEMEELLLEQRGSMNRVFQRTGSRTLNPLAFHKAIKGDPAGRVTVLAKIDGGEPHQFAWEMARAQPQRHRLVGRHKGDIGGISCSRFDRYVCPMPKCTARRLAYQPNNGRREAIESLGKRHGGVR